MTHPHPSRVPTLLALTLVATASAVALATDAPAPSATATAPTHVAPHAPSAQRDPATAAILGTVPSLTPAALRERQRTARPVVLDVRTAEEYAAGHVPGALNVAHDQIEQRLSELAPHRDDEVVLYCRSGRRAALAIERLRAAGFTQLRHLEGDYLGWEQETAGTVAEAASTAPAVTPKGPGGAPATPAGAAPR